jgi:hypothetical protein
MTAGAVPEACAVSRIKTESAIKETYSDQATLQVVGASESNS